MNVQTMNPEQAVPLEAHLDAASTIDAAEVALIRRLAEQLHNKPVMPIVGAGCSYDCGMLLASEIAKSLRTAYLANPAYDPHIADPDPTLGTLTEAIATRRGQRAAVEAVGLQDSTRWPSASEFTPHFCVYRALTRLSRERLHANSMPNAMGFNYDSGWDAALKDEGVMSSPGTIAGRLWSDHATIITDAATNNPEVPLGRFVLVKAHGCAQRYRSEIARDPTCHAENDIVIRANQLLNWGKRGWSRDFFANNVHNNVLLLVGFSGQDPVIAGTLEEILAEVHTAEMATDIPRVIVVDREPNTARLQQLIAAGRGRNELRADAVTEIRVPESSTTTAIALILLAEALALDLGSTFAASGWNIPDDMDARLAALVVSAPVMMRWSYLLRTPARDDFYQRANLQQAERGYVPLATTPSSTAQALRTRSEVRKALGWTKPESSREALENHGFLVAGGCAFLPVGLDHDELRNACRPGGPIDQAKSTVPHPDQLDCILVSDEDGKRCGTHIDTGAEVKVP
jgi:hypothetical protein